MAVIAETKRLIIREMTTGEADMKALFSLYEDPRMTEFMEPLFPYEEEVEYEKNYIERVYAYYGYGLWFLEEKETKEVIGRAGVEYREGCEKNEGELGFQVSFSRQRRGFAYEALTKIIELSFFEFGFDSLRARINPANAPSIALAKKLFLSPSGTFEKDQRGNYDEIYRLRKEDYGNAGKLCKRRT